ncbi:hypothetical protein D1007_50656 [Hordeum vulgare]|nr:hypothetical protein D1007_50656 [Hordeum vulgare]
MKLADYDPYEGAFSDDSEYEYDSGDDVYRGNVASFTTKRCRRSRPRELLPCVASSRSGRYCTTKPKPNDGRFDHLLSHAEDVAIHGRTTRSGGSMLRSRRP